MVQIVVKLSQTSEPLQEYAIIELQGELESKQNLGLAGKFVGDLHFAKDGTPILIIGHHMLYGKCVSLEKPLAIMKKSEISKTLSQTDDDINPSPSSVSYGLKNTNEYLLEAVVKKKILFKTRPKPIVINVPKKV